MKKLFPLFIFALFAIVACDDDDKKVPLDNSVVQFIESTYSSTLPLKLGEYRSYMPSLLKIFSSVFFAKPFVNTSANCSSLLMYGVSISLA